jgi:hypothetical protein
MQTGLTAKNAKSAKTEDLGAMHHGMGGLTTLGSAFLAIFAVE